MPDTQTNSLIQLVSEVKQAIQIAQGKPQVQGIKITQVDLEIKTTLTRDASGKLSWQVIELSGDISQASTQVISLSLVPTPAENMFKAFTTVSQGLIEAMEAIATGASAAAASRPSFDLKQATVSIAIGMTKDGAIKVFVGGGGKSEVTHTVTVTFGR